MGSGMVDSYGENKEIINDVFSILKKRKALDSGLN